MIEPEPYLLLIFGILGLLLLLRPSRGSQDATAQHSNDADYAPHRHPPKGETVSRAYPLQTTQLGLDADQVLSSSDRSSSEI
jgi:hypothetical protein